MKTDLLGWHQNSLGNKTYLEMTRGSLWSLFTSLSEMTLISGRRNTSVFDGGVWSHPQLEEFILNYVLYYQNPPNSKFWDVPGPLSLG